MHRAEKINEPALGAKQGHIDVTSNTAVILPRVTWAQRTGGQAASQKHVVIERTYF